MACQLMADPYNASDRVFSQIANGKGEARIAAHINRVLKSLYQSDVEAILTPGLQSHSARRGGAAHASSHGDVNLSYLAHRGLWSMDGFATLLEYILPTSSSDQTIANVLGGWTDPKKAGLRHHWLALIRVDMKLKAWGRFVRKQFVLENLLSLPVGYVKSNMSERELSEQCVGIHTFAEALERGVMGYREVVAEMHDVKSLIHRVLDEQHALRLMYATPCCCD